MIWCPEIYKGLYLRPADHNSVYFGPCCQSIIGKTDNKNFDYHSNEFKKIRIENQQNIKSVQCSRCWDIEKNGGYSKRLSSIDFYNHINSTNTDVELISFEYNVNWSCNLACIMCGPEFSSRWATELNIKFESSSKHTHNPILNDLDFSKIKRLHFNGGEPLLNDDHCYVLNKINNLSECKISYNTNGTKLPSNKAIDLWQKSKAVRIFFSIDATEEAFEYIRYPGKWQDVEKNIRWYIDNSPSNVMFGLNVAVGSYNVLEVSKLWNWFKTVMPTNRDRDKSEFNWQEVRGFSFHDLREEVKQLASLRLKSIEELKSLYKNISNSSGLQSDQWIKKLNEIDNRRSTNWKKSLEIGKYYK